MFIIQRVDGQYVTVSGSEHSYSKRIEKARIFYGREAAERELCLENEKIIPIDQVLSGCRLSKKG